MRNKRFILIAGLVCLLVAHGAFQVWLSWNENQTIDEGVHISAGVTYLKTGDFRLNPEHPPLAKMIAAAPVLFLNPHVPLESEEWATAEQWGFARRFMYHSGNNPDAILFYGRMPIIIMTLLLGWVIIAWSKRVAGWIGGYVSAILFATFPTFLAHGHLITTDVPVTLFITTGAYAMYLWVIKSKLKYLFASAAFFGLAANVKFTGIMAALVAIGILWFITSLKNQIPILPNNPIKKWFACMLLVTIGIALITTGFTTSTFGNDPYHGVVRIQELDQFMSNKSGIVRQVLQGYRSLLIHIPLPAYPYVNGLAMFMDHTAGGHESYFYGSYSKTGSFWYFPAAFILKSPLSMIICITLLFAIFVKKSFYTWKFNLPKIPLIKKTGAWFKTFSPLGSILALMPIGYLAFSLISRVNIGVRHILPMFPFVLVGIATLFVYTIKRKLLFNWLLICILAINLITVVMIYPYPMAYFSEIVGGPKNGYRYLLDSNLDWGQNLKYLKKYLHTNNIPRVCYSYFGQGDFDHEQILGDYLPPSYDTTGRERLNCVVAISAQSLYSSDNAYDWLRPYTPVEVVGYGMYIFDFRKPR